MAHRFSALSGPIAGIMIAGYFVYRKRRLQVAELHKPDPNPGTKGLQWVALIALALSILPNLPGVVATIKVLAPFSVAPLFSRFIIMPGLSIFTLAFILYLLRGNLAAPDWRRTI